MTPDDLIDDGLYSDLAIPLMSAEFREISLVMLAKELGAANR